MPVVEDAEGDDLEGERDDDKSVVSDAEEGRAISRPVEAPRAMASGPVIRNGRWWSRDRIALAYAPIPKKAAWAIETNPPKPVTRFNELANMPNRAASVTIWNT